MEQRSSQTFVRLSLSLSVCLLLAISSGIDGTQYLVAKWLFQMPARLRYGIWAWSSSHWLLTVVCLCCINVLVTNLLLNFLRDPRRGVRLLAIGAVGLQFASVVASRLLLKMYWN